MNCGKGMDVQLCVLQNLLDEHRAEYMAKKSSRETHLDLDFI